MRRSFRSAVVVAVLAFAGGAHAETTHPVKPVKPEVTRTRTRTGEAPCTGTGACTGEKKSAPAAKSEPGTPSKPLSGAELEVVVRDALARGDAKLPRGATVTKVTSSLPVNVPAGTTKTGLELTPPARRPGVTSTTAVITFSKGETLLGRSPVTLEITSSKDAMPEVAKGTPVVLVVRRDGFEITTPGITATDGDVGEVVSVLLRPSGRSFRAQLVTRERAVAVEDPR